MLAAAENLPAVIDRTIASGFRLLRFPGALEARFEADTGKARVHELIMRGMLGLVLFNVFLISDWQLMPDRAEYANWLRLGLVTPIACLVMFIIALRPPAVLRETLAALIVVLASTVPPLLILSSESPLRESGHYAVLLVVMFATMVQRIRFWYALAAVAAIEVMYFGTLTQLPSLAPEEVVSFNMVFAGGALFSLVASYSLERDRRMTYLLALRDGLKNQELETISRRDPLTGLGNRRSLDAALRQLVENTPPGSDASVLLIDIDHFKPFNDSLGHQAGDDCLKLVAALIVSELREQGDLAFRFGGEEFLIVLRNADLQRALAIGERLRRVIARAGIRHPEARTGFVTVSVGVASTRIGSAITARELISSADAALYAAKRAGRNQVWPKAVPAPDELGAPEQIRASG